MPADLNRVTLVGRLTRDPELRHTTGGTAVCTIRLGVTSRTRDQGGEWADRPNYFDITVFGRQAETVAEHMGKGRRVGVDGRLAWREWETPDGTKRQAVEVVAQDVFFLDAPREDHSPRATSDIPPAPAAHGAHADTDIPF